MLTNKLNDKNKRVVVFNFGLPITDGDADTLGEVMGSDDSAEVYSTGYVFIDLERGWARKDIADMVADLQKRSGVETPDMIVPHSMAVAAMIVGQMFPDVPALVIKRDGAEKRQWVHAIDSKEGVKFV